MDGFNYAPFRDGAPRFRLLEKTDAALLSLSLSSRVAHHPLREFSVFYFFFKYNNGGGQPRAKVKANFFLSSEKKFSKIETIEKSFEKSNFQNSITK